MKMIPEGEVVTALMRGHAFGAYLLSGPLRTSRAVGGRMIGLQPVQAISGAAVGKVIDIEPRLDACFSREGTAVSAATVQSGVFAHATLDSSGDDIHVAGFTVGIAGADSIGIGHHVVRMRGNVGATLRRLHVVEAPDSFLPPPGELAGWSAPPGIQGGLW